MNRYLRKSIYLFAIIIVLCINSIAWGASSDTITLPLPNMNVSLSTRPDGFVVFANSVISGNPGEPGLPLRTFKVLLPPDADPNTVKVTITNQIITNVTGTYNVEPVPYPACEEPTPAPPIVLLNKWYPEARLSKVSGGNLRGWRLAEAQVYPYQYNPVTKRLRYLSKGNLVITFNRTPGNNRPLPESDPLSMKYIPQLQKTVMNYPAMAPLYLNRTPGALQATDPAYVIITTSALQAASTQLNSFIGTKQAQGFNVQVITESAWGGGTGDVAADRIRAWLADNYISLNIQYVLIIGNPDPALSPTPMKTTYPFSPAEPYPTDYYFAELTGNWDLNGNGLFGEFFGDVAPGGAERNTEVLVGRIPYYGVLADLDHILAKIVNFETSPFANWRRHVILPMAPLDPDTQSFELGEQIKDLVLIPNGFNYTRIYADNYGLAPPPEIVPVNVDNVTNAWIANPAGAVFWQTHGFSQGASEVMDVPHALTLNDAFPAHTFQASCSNAFPTDPVNLAYILLLNGAVNTIGCTSLSWYFPGQTDYTNSLPTNGAMAFEYASRLIGNQLTSSEALQDLKTTIDPGIPEFWANYLGFNIYGDPYSGVFTAGPAAASAQLLYQNQRTEPVSNLIHPNLRVTNTGGIPINLADMKIRYWYTREPAQPQVYEVYYSNTGNSNVTGAFIPVTPARPGANYYLEIGFTGAAGSLAPLASVDVNSAFHTTVYSNYNQANDYSYDGTFFTLAPYNRITVYVNGTLVWGIEP
ncbi:MAG: hypothetical protein K6U80_02930 [Firmicutes bacterium]|nr:hypothetical protein [Bacillota bacterium]